MNFGDGDVWMNKPTHFGKVQGKWMNFGDGDVWMDKPTHFGNCRENG
jgi:hypothetical protein